MTAATQQIVNALMGVAREHGFPADHAQPVDWIKHDAELRYRWAALAALEHGDLLEAGVLAQLSVAAGIEHIADVFSNSQDKPWNKP